MRMSAFTVSWERRKSSAETEIQLAARRENRWSIPFAEVASALPSDIDFSKKERQTRRHKLRKIHTNDHSWTRWTYFYARLTYFIIVIVCIRVDKFSFVSPIYTVDFIYRTRGHANEYTCSNLLCVHFIAILSVGTWEIEQAGEARSTPMFRD